MRVFMVASHHFRYDSPLGFASKAPKNAPDLGEV